MSARNNFADTLIDWQQKHGRNDLPWQATKPDAYRVWVSEIMLQQTQVATVIGYFKKFMDRFPSVGDLALADEQEVLSLWSGLGYYARARNLLACAQRIMAHHGGRFPQTADSLTHLPGIGPSTAAAIASIVYGQREAVLDGNVKRVLARLVCADEPWGSDKLHKKLLPLAQGLLPAKPAQMPRYTQAIMDLGATICTAAQPRCGLCPVKTHCKAHKSNRVGEFPRPRLARAAPVVEIFWLLPFDCESVWLNPRPSHGIWGGLWTPWQLDLRAMPDDWPYLRSFLSGEHRLDHRLTHRELKISMAAMDLRGKTSHQLARARLAFPKTLRAFLWADVFNEPLPSPVRRLLLNVRPLS